MNIVQLGACVGNDYLTQDDIYSFLENKGYNIIKKWGYVGCKLFDKKI